MQEEKKDSQEFVEGGNVVPPGVDKPKKKEHIIRRIFITGIVAMLPLVVTVYILKILYGLIVSNLMPLFVRLAHLYHVAIPEAFMGILTVAMFILLIFLIGLLTRLYVGRFLLNLVEKTITAIPLANTIYNAIKQMIDSFKSSSNNFQKVVLVNFPSDKAYCLAFVVKDSQPILTKAMGVPSYNVYVPTAPNPTSGFITIFPVSGCVELDVTVEEGIKFILSVGLINFTSDADAKTQIKNKIK